VIVTTSAAARNALRHMLSYVAPFCLLRVRVSPVARAESKPGPTEGAQSRLCIRADAHIRGNDEPS
jgi:hypothetical protein